MFTFCLPFYSNERNKQRQQQQHIISWNSAETVLFGENEFHVMISHNYGTPYGWDLSRAEMVFCTLKFVELVEKMMRLFKNCYLNAVKMTQCTNKSHQGKPLCCECVCMGAYVI